MHCLDFLSQDIKDARNNLEELRNELHEFLFTKSSKIVVSDEFPNLGVFMHYFAPFIDTTEVVASVINCRKTDAVGSSDIGTQLLSRAFNR